MDKFALHRASLEGKLERVRQLIEEGVSVDEQDDWGHTPLHLAAVKGRYEVAELLISEKCDLDIKDKDGWTPVMLAAACGDNIKHVVDLLLQCGAQMNYAGKDKFTLLLLHYASQDGWTDIVRLILDSGEADINAASVCGQFPLLWAAQAGHEDVVAFLIRAGADVNLMSYEMKTALHAAASSGSTSLVHVLLDEEGLDLNPQDRYGETPLHWACYGGWREIVKQLLVAGADTAIKGIDGETALSLGIARESLTLEEIRLFVQKGAFLEHCDYVHISQNPVLKEGVLKDVGLCTQSIVNKFHLQSLPALNSISYFARKLPNVNKFKLNDRQIDEVENLVKGEIEINTFCNVVKAHPMTLSALCVLSLITCQSGTE